jgi:DNA-binding GntR family transcriptional regulator
VTASVSSGVTAGLSSGVTAGLSSGVPVRGERTADVVARRLAQAILSGEIAPGTRLREENLARMFSVSRTPVREALIVLSSTGLAHLEANRGATVLQLTAGDVAEVYHLRAVLEAESAALAAGRTTAEPATAEPATAEPATAEPATGGLAGLLLAICDRMAELHEAPAAEQLAADTQFHYTIAEASGSPRLHALVRQVSAIPEAYRSAIPYTGADMSEAERQHRGIAGAIQRNDAGEARRLMRSHVEWAGRLAVDRLQPNLATGRGTDPQPGP